MFGVHVSVCLSVCDSDTSKSNECTILKFLMLIGSDQKEQLIKRCERSYSGYKTYHFQCIFNDFGLGGH